MNNKWIPVSSGERPPEGESVQVTFLPYLTYNDEESECDRFAYQYGNVWFWSFDETECNVVITAWKPCGEPYRGKENV